MTSARGVFCFLLGAGFALALVSWRMSIPLVLSCHTSAKQLDFTSDNGPQVGVDQRQASKAEVLLPWHERGFVSRVELGEVARKLAINGTVIMTVSNHGYQDFLENWMAFSAKIGLHKHLLIVAEDVESWDHSEHLWPGQAVRIHVPELEDADEETQRALGLEGAGSSGGGASEFNSPRFKKMMFRRVFYIRELLYARVNVLLTDTDIVFLQDPLPVIVNARMPEPRLVPAPKGVPQKKTAVAVPVPYDFLGMLDEPDGKGFQKLDPYPVPPNATLQYLTKSNFCGGFLFFRSTPAAWAMVDLLAMKLFRGEKSTGKENEQTFLALVLWEALNMRPRARAGILPQQLFVPGWLFFTDNKYQWWRQRFKRDPRNKPLIVHNNWVTGREAKIRRFIEKGLWAVPHSDGRVGDKTG